MYRCFGACDDDQVLLLKPTSLSTQNPTDHTSRPACEGKATTPPPGTPNEPNNLETQKSTTLQVYYTRQVASRHGREPSGPYCLGFATASPGAMSHDQRGQVTLAGREPRGSDLLRLTPSRSEDIASRPTGGPSGLTSPGWYPGGEPPRAVAVV